MIPITKLIANRYWIEGAFKPTKNPVRMLSSEPKERIRQENCQ